MLKKIIISILLISLFSTFSVAASNDVNLDNLSSQEKTLYFELLKKSQYNKGTQASSELAKNIQELKGIDVNSLNEWRVFITNTIKDICRDLNVSVNEFIQTPAGAGIAGLIIYKVAGKDILFKIVGKVFDVAFIVPFWFFMMAFLFWMRRKYFSTILIYDKIEEIHNEKGKITSVIKKKPEKRLSYNFHSNESRTFTAAFIIGSFLVTNVVTLLVIFAK